MLKTVSASVPLLCAITLLLGASLAVAAEPAPGLLDRAQEGARAVATQAEELRQGFAQRLLGKSLMLGVSNVLTGASLINSAGTFESYTGRDRLSPAFAFNSASAQDVVFKEYDVAGIHFLDTLNFLANYARFDADRQTLQRLTGGQAPAGYVRGNLLYGVALFGYNGIHEGERVNWGFRAGVGLGAALARFEGRIDDAAGGVNRTDTFSHGYNRPMLAYLMLFEARIGQFVASAQSIQLYGTVQTDATQTRFAIQMGLVNLQIGYAFYF